MAGVIKIRKSHLIITSYQKVHTNVSFLRTSSRFTDKTGLDQTLSLFERKGDWRNSRKLTVENKGEKKRDRKKRGK